MNNFLSGIVVGVLCCVLAFGSFEFLNIFEPSLETSLREQRTQKLEFVEIPSPVPDTNVVYDTLTVAAPRQYLDTPRLLNSEPFELLNPNFGRRRIELDVFNADLGRPTTLSVSLPKRRGMVVGAGYSNRGGVLGLGWQRGRFTGLGFVGPDLYGAALLYRF